jgi:hypothetical protein
MIAVALVVRVAILVTFRLVVLGEWRNDSHRPYRIFPYLSLEQPRETLISDVILNVAQGKPRVPFPDFLFVP